MQPNIYPTTESLSLLVIVVSIRKEATSLRLQLARERAALKDPLQIHLSDPLFALRRSCLLCVYALSPMRVL